MANKAEVIDHIYLKVIFLNKLDNDVSTKDTLFQFNNYLGILTSNLIDY